MPLTITMHGYCEVHHCLGKSCEELSASEQRLLVANSIFITVCAVLLRSVGNTTLN